MLLLASLYFSDLSAMIGRKFALLTIMNNADTDLDSVITTVNAAVTETASEILGKHRQKKKPWVTAEILDLCGRRRELRKKRFEPEGSEKYREVNSNIKRCMKEAKENWIGEQCSESEENLRKNNSKRAYQLVKDLTTVKQGKATTVQDHSGKCLTEEREILNRWTEQCTGLAVTKLMEIFQYWTVPRQTQRTVSYTHLRAHET